MKTITNKERAAFYETEYATDVDRAFLKSLVTHRVNTILEIPCGVGRNLAWLYETGCHVMVADLEPAMIKRLSERIEELGDNATSRVHPVIADMRTIELNRTFDLILVPQGGFQLLLTPHDALSALHRFRRHLAPGETLLIDLATFQPGPQEDEAIRPSYYHPSIPNGLLVFDWRRSLPLTGVLTRFHAQDWQTEVLTTHFYYRREDANGREETYRFVMRSRRYTYDSFLSLASQANLAPQVVFRNYTGDIYKGSGYRMIFLLECV